MKMRMRPRYYCDHCGKAGGNPGAIRRHEESCTANPARACKLCRGINGGEGWLDEGKAAFADPAHGSDWKARMQALRDATKDCPCCILAVLRQSGVLKPADPDPDGGGGYAEGMHWTDCRGGHALLGFNFKAEMEGAMATLRDRRNDDRNY